jgi:hypothetical protein
LIGDDTKQRITGDVQFLLDFAIIGFAKSGTTALSKWLDTHPEISDFLHECGMLIKIKLRISSRDYTKSFPILLPMKWNENGIFMGTSALVILCDLYLLKSWHGIGPRLS